MASVKKYHSLTQQIEVDRVNHPNAMMPKNHDLSGIPSGPGLAVDPMVAQFLASLPSKLDLGRLKGLTLSDPNAAMALLTKVRDSVHEQSRTAQALVGLQSGELMEHAVLQ
jgi:hypothetical protein